jgi:hypothetical protein
MREAHVVRLERDAINCVCTDNNERKIEIGDDYAEK